MVLPVVPAPGGPPVLTLTDNAVTRVKELLEEEGEPGLSLRVVARPGGCAGLRYDMYFDTDVAGDDVIRRFGEVQVVIDPLSVPHLEGAQLDCNDDTGQPEFSMDNPNNSGGHTCTCGKNAH